MSAKRCTSWSAAACPWWLMMVSPCSPHSVPAPYSVRCPCLTSLATKRVIDVRPTFAHWVSFGFLFFFVSFRLPFGHIQKYDWIFIRINNWLYNCRIFRFILFGETRFVGNVGRLPRGPCIAHRTRMPIAAERWIVGRGFICEWVFLHGLLIRIEFVISISGKNTWLFYLLTHSNRYEIQSSDDCRILIRPRHDLRRPG